MNRLFKFVKLFFQYKWEEIGDNGSALFAFAWITISTISFAVMRFFNFLDSIDRFDTTVNQAAISIFVIPTTVMLVVVIGYEILMFFRWIGSNIKRAWEDSK